MFSLHRRSGFSANDGRWYHICVTWRNSDGAWKFYKDGVLHHHSIYTSKEATQSGPGDLWCWDKNKMDWEQVLTLASRFLDFWPTSMCGLMSCHPVWYECIQGLVATEQGMSTSGPISETVLKAKPHLSSLFHANGWASATATLCSNIMAVRKFR